MPKHALDRVTIAQLILSQLPKDVEAQLFLLNFEWLILRDFSTYVARQSFEDRPVDAVISSEYFSIIKELMEAELPADQATKLLTLLNEMQKASPEESRELAGNHSNELPGLFRFFPQHCFAYIGGAFFEAFLKGDKHVQGFKQKRQVYTGNLPDLSAVYSTNSSPYSNFNYTHECGNFADWLNKPFRLNRKWLYVAPVICDGSFFGLLYRFSDDDSAAVAADLRRAVTQAETLFRDMRYALIADVAVRIGRLEDPLNAFLAELPKYQNIGLAASWSEKSPPVVYARGLVEGAGTTVSKTSGCQLRWQLTQSRHIYVKGFTERAHELSSLSDSIADSWVEVTKNDSQIAEIGADQKRIAQIFNNDVLRSYEEAGLSLKFGVVIPGKLIRPDLQHRHLELYFFEPAAANIGRRPNRFLSGITRKMHSLIPVLQEIAVFESSAEDQARRLNHIIASLVFHEVKNSLRRRTVRSEREDSRVPQWLHEHINRCLDAYGNLKMKPCLRSDWTEVVKWLQVYWSHYFENDIHAAEWPKGLGPIRLSKELVYVISCELIKNAITRKAQSIKLAVSYQSATGLAVLSVTNDGKIDFDLLKANLAAYWSEGLIHRNRNGLALIIQLLRVLHSAPASPVTAEMAGKQVRVCCHLALAT